MVGFGNSIRQSHRTGWEGAYLNYDKLEAALTRLETCVLAASQRGGAGDGARRAGEEHQPLLFKNKQKPSPENNPHGFEDRLVKHSQAFLRDLHLEIERVALFSLKKQGELADSVGSLRFEDPIFSGLGVVLLLEQDEIISSNNNNSKVDQYSHVGVELLHLLRFIGINYTGVRKILEKFEKVVYELMNMATDTYDIETKSVRRLKSSNSSSSGISHSDDYHLRELANSAPIVAIQASLSHAMQQCLLNQDALIQDPSSLWRFEFVLASIQTIRQSAADIVNSPFSNFLSRKAMIATGKNLNGLESSALKAQQEVLLQFDPDSIRRMTAQELQAWHQQNTAMDQLQFGGTLFVVAPAADRRQSRHRRLMSSNGPICSAIEDEMKQEDAAAKRYYRHWGGIDSVSLAINFVSVLLYTVGYYVVAPNANHYAINLGYDGAFGATLIGTSSFAALFGAFLYSFWYTQFSFKSALIFSSLCPLLGNLLYSLAASFHNIGMPMAICGRFLCGFGSAEVVNRQIISTCVSFEKMTRASAFFVAAGAVGMSLGPLLGSVFDLTAGRDYEVDLKVPMMPAGGIIYNHITGPCFFMAGLWFTQLLALIVFFREPDRVNVTSGRHTVFDSSVSGSLTMQVVEQGDDKVSNGHGHGKEKSGSPWSSVLNEVSKTTRLVFQNPGLPVTLLLFCYIEMADEVLISSCSMVTHRYFGWHGSAAGLTIASLGALVLPADFVVERASHKSSERKIMVMAIVFLCFTLVGIMNYEGLFYDLLGPASEIFEHTHNDTEVKLGNETIGDLLNQNQEFPYDWGAGRVIYIVFLSAFFMGTIILEGVDTSLMAKVTPAKLNSAFINSGFLATIIGTLGRVIADLLITTSALLDVGVFVDFVNATFFPLLLLALGGYFLVKRYYKEFLIS